MIDSDRLLFLEDLLSTPSPTGYETAGQQIWLKELRKYSDRQETDLYGSAAAFIDVDPDAITVMLEAHCDEIGMVVQHVDSSGFVYINRLGGSDPAISRAKKVSIHTAKGVVRGLIGNTAIHLQERGKDRKSPAWEDLFVDIGAESREEALEMLQIGDPITYSEDVEFFSDDLIVARALDNRIGGYIIAEAMRHLYAIKDTLKVNVVAVNAVQEEIGGFGARMMSYRLHPDAALVTDVTHATDSPGINQKMHGKVELAKGAVITHGTANQRRLVEKLVAVAEAKEIPLQHEASGTRTGTDTDSVFHSKTGIPSALISTPLRYMHSPTEMASLSDVDAVARLMKESVAGFEAKEDFRLM